MSDPDSRYRVQPDVFNNRRYVVLDAATYRVIDNDMPLEEARRIAGELNEGD